MTGALKSLDCDALQGLSLPIRHTTQETGMDFMSSITKWIKLTYYNDVL